MVRFYCIKILDSRCRYGRTITCVAHPTTEESVLYQSVTTPCVGWRQDTLTSAESHFFGLTGDTRPQSPIIGQWSRPSHTMIMSPGQTQMCLRKWSHSDSHRWIIINSQNKHWWLAVTHFSLVCVTFIAFCQILDHYSPVSVDFHSGLWWIWDCWGAPLRWGGEGFLALSHPAWVCSPRHHTSVCELYSVQCSVHYCGVCPTMGTTTERLRPAWEPGPGWNIRDTASVISHDSLIAPGYCGNTGKIRGFVYYRCMLQVHCLLFTLPRNFSPPIRVQVIRLSLTHQFVTKYPSHIQFDPERDLNIHESVR